MRTAEIKRKTKETDISLKLTLEGGERRIDTGIGFFDHMLNSFAVHSGFGLTLTCKGDLEVDGHHSVEDCGIALGQALAQCVGERRVSRVSDRRSCRWTRRSVSARWISPAARTSCSTHPCRSRCAGSTTPA